MREIGEIEFENIIQEHELLILKVCRIYSSQRYGREDLFQEIVIQLWHSFQSFKGQSKLSTWIYKVALYTAIARFRKEKSCVHFSENNLSIDTSDDINNTIADEQLKVLYEAIEQLNEIEKAIILLYLDKNSYAEMENIIGIPQGNLRVKMSRIKDKLKQMSNKKLYGN